MRVGVPTEVKNNEFRVAVTPAGVHALVGRGHEVLVQAGAGVGSGISDSDFVGAGARVVGDVESVWGDADLVLKVKEPVAEEYGRLHEGLVLFTYLHLAADEVLTRELLGRGVTSIAYETVELGDRSLPLLSPMSEIAGRLAAQVGANCLLQSAGGRGVLFGGGSGVRRGRVSVLGGGVAGLCAARVAAGMGADVTVFDVDVARMRYIDEVWGGRIGTRFSSPLAVREACGESDVVIGSVLVPGARTPHLVDHETVLGMVPGSVFYCVANMPGAVPCTSTYALTNATMRYVLLLADEGWRGACGSRGDLRCGLATHGGKLLSAPVGEALGIECVPVSEVL